MKIIFAALLLSACSKPFPRPAHCSERFEQLAPRMTDSKCSGEGVLYICNGDIIRHCIYSDKDVRHKIGEVFALRPK